MCGTISKQLTVMAESPLDPFVCCLREESNWDSHQEITPKTEVPISPFRAPFPPHHRSDGHTGAPKAVAAELGEDRATRRLALGGLCPGFQLRALLGPSGPPQPERGAAAPACVRPASARVCVQEPQGPLFAEPRVT